MRYISKILLIIFSISILFAIFELILVITSYKMKPLGWPSIFLEDTMYEVDSRTIYKMKKNYKDAKGEGEIWATDSNGFRFNPDVLEQPDSYEIIALGDSLVYSTKVNHRQAYPYLVQKDLVMKGKNVEVKNAGIGGYGFDQEYLFLLYYVLPKMTPNLVIWNIYPNDIVDSNEACLLRMKGEELIKLNPFRNTLTIIGYVSKILPPFAKSSRSLNFILSRIPARDTIGCTNIKESVEEENYQKFSLIIRKMKKNADEGNYKLLIVLSPFQAYFDMRAYPNVSGEMKIYNRLLSEIEKSGVDYVDSNKEIAKLKGPEVLVVRLEGSENNDVQNLDNDVEEINLSKELFLDESSVSDYGWYHPNALGNELFAEVVSEKLLGIVD